MKSPSPIFLFHGSAFVATSLKPGFEHTGVEQKWDETESNRFLYASELKHFASEMGFATALDKKYPQKEFHSKDNEIQIVLDMKSPPITQAGLKNTWYYLYTLRFRKEDGWIKVNNEVNNAPNEWKTEKTIYSIIRSERISCMDFLKDKKITIEHPRYPIVRLGYRHGHQPADS